MSIKNVGAWLIILTVGIAVGHGIVTYENEAKILWFTAFFYLSTQFPFERENYHSLNISGLLITIIVSSLISLTALLTSNTDPLWYILLLTAITRNFPWEERSPRLINLNGMVGGFILGLGIVILAIKQNSPETLWYLILFGIYMRLIPWKFKKSQEQLRAEGLI